MNVTVGQYWYIKYYILGPVNIWLLGNSHDIRSNIYPVGIQRHTAAFIKCIYNISPSRS